jgi:hypothetical protein
MVQSSFQAGDLRAGLPAIEVAEPLIASILGIMLLHERLHATNLPSKALICLTVIGMAWTAIELARSAALDHETAEDRLDGHDGRLGSPRGSPRADHI